MALGDYLLCTRCGAKVVYDAEVEYDVPSFGWVIALCDSCHQAEPALYALVQAIVKGEATITYGDAT